MLVFFVCVGAQKIAFKTRTGFYLLLLLFSGSPNVQTLLSDITCHGFDVWCDHVHCHSIVRCWGWGTLSTATAANESWLLEVFNTVLSFPRRCTFFPPRKLNLWAAALSGLPFSCYKLSLTDFSRPWDVHANHRSLQLERSECRRCVKSCLSLCVCDVLLRNTVGCIDSVYPKGHPTSFPGSSPTWGPSRRGPWKRGWCLPLNVLTSRSAWREITGLLDSGLVTFILLQYHFERHVKE